MKINRRFAIYNICMLLTPILLIGVISVCFFVVFVFKYPIEQLPIGRTALLNPSVFIRAVGDFFQRNPQALRTVLIWIGLCVLILVASITLFTMHMARSITKPIAELTFAAEKIRSGNLDFEVLGSPYEEIDILCTEFDTMRKALRTAGQKEKALQNERSMLLANLSHDLKTPIAAIRGYVDGILDGVADSPEKMQQYLNIVASRAEAIDNMVNHLSDFSKLELSRLEFSFAVGDLNQFVAELAEEYRLDLEKNEITLHTEFSKQSVPVKLDYEKMERVLTNLFDNAIKYKQPGAGKLTLRTSASPEGMYLAVCDDGVGIHQEQLRAVFQEFYRADQARTANIRGSGLGLAIARQIVMRHGGKIWIRSDGENQGTTVVIFLPNAAEK